MGSRYSALRLRKRSLQTSSVSASTTETNLRSSSSAFEGAGPGPGATWVVGSPPWRMTLGSNPKIKPAMIRITVPMPPPAMPSGTPMPRRSSTLSLCLPICHRMIDSFRAPGPSRQPRRFWAACQSCVPTGTASAKRRPACLGLSLPRWRRRIRAVNRDDGSKRRGEVPRVEIASDDPFQGPTMTRAHALLGDSLAVSIGADDCVTTILLAGTGSPSRSASDNGASARTPI